MRQYNVIKSITSYDKRFLLEMANCCHSCGSFMNGRRINQFIKSGLITPEKESLKTEYAYRLTKKGEKFVRSNFEITNFYKSNSLRHDKKLLEIYRSNNSEDWGTEKDANQLYQDLIRKYETEGRFDEAQHMRDLILQKKVSPPDAIIYTKAKPIFIEVITRNYKDDMIQAKINFANELNIKLIIYRA